MTEPLNPKGVKVVFAYKPKTPPKGWAAVPGTEEQAPILGIIVLVIVCGILFAGLVTGVVGVLLYAADFFLLGC